MLCSSKRFCEVAERDVAVDLNGKFPARLTLILLPAMTIGRLMTEDFMTCPLSRPCFQLNGLPPEFRSNERLTVWRVAVGMGARISLR